MENTLCGRTLEEVEKEFDNFQFIHSEVVATQPMDDLKSGAEQTENMDENEKLLKKVNKPFS